METQPSRQDAATGFSYPENEDAAPRDTRKAAHNSTGSHYTVNPASIPAELRTRSQWLCWRFETRDGKPTKVPKCARTGGNASSRDSVTWCDFETAVTAYHRAGYSGIGFAFQDGDRLTGLDLDHVIDLETGDVDPRALEILERFKGTYCEVSPSGTGLRIFAHGKPGRTGKNEGKVKWLEVYDNTSPRYLTVTGNHWSGTSGSVTEQQAALDWLHAAYFVKADKPQPATRPAPAVDLTLDDTALLDKAMAARNGGRFRELWNGDTNAYGGDDSAADLALCSLLAFWTQKDAGRIDRLFRRSGLKREKWNRPDYRQRTIDKAIAECSEVYSERRKGGNGHDTSPPNFDLPPVEAYDEVHQAAGTGGNEPPKEPLELPKLPRVVLSIDDLTIEPPAPPFLIEAYMPRDVQALIGTGGTGKSTLDILQSIHLILGRPLWDMEIIESGPVVYVTAEDGETRLKWRLFHIVNQLGLNRSERQQVADHFHIVNLVGTGRKLVAQDRDGNLVITSLADQIIEEHLPIAPVRVSFDPMVKFGPGERMVNDGEDMLVNAGHRITQTLHCATNFTHHVSKDVARNGTVDHHSGRGGSALGDGVRAAYQLLMITPDLSKGYPGTELYRDDIANLRLLALHITKLTDAKRPPEPMILRRNGWLFEPVAMPEPKEVERAVEVARQERAKQNLKTVAAYLKEHGFTRLTRRNLEDMYEDIGIPRNAIRGAIAKGLMERTLIEVELPPDEQHGAKKTYLTVAVGGEQ